jgi:hypothetical protein
MKLSIPALGGFLLVAFLSFALQLNSSQQKCRRQPRPPCHGATGDGKGDLAASMGLKMNDWRDSSTLSGLTDGEIFDVIVKGKGKMTGEGDRASNEKVWELVNYVRSFAKKEGAIPKASMTR